ncbi:MAG: hypothetical protein AAF529_00165 [Pseudomonadota bacterium]
MPNVTLTFAGLLIALGIAAYVLTGQTSVTAMIPSFFGIGLGLAGLAARREAWRKHAMHAAAAIALLGLIGAGMRAIPALFAEGAMRGATLAQLCMVVLMLVFLWLAVRSFIDARRTTGDPG